jgi:ATP-dependent RNA helicase SUPV3L1/SUV3
MIKKSTLSLPPQARARGVTAVLGPTNTGKTHLAIERMLAHSSGLIGLPLRLLAREVYGRLVERAGVDAVALITGEEKIKPPNPRFWVATAEAMPRDLDVAFVAIDEVQIAVDFDRGHVFTDHMLNRRGREETLILGSSTMKPIVEQLIPGVNVVTRPRLSNLSFAGEKKVTRLPPRAAIVAFSAEEVYAIAELLRRQRGGAAVVMGALSPRTRNAQVDLFQSGDVDYIVATDAIGMGLNLDINHVAFASDRKYDGRHNRRLTASEFGQIAGRAGRHLRDGTFGSSGRCAPFEPELIEALENHSFEPVRMIQWRNPDLDTSSVESLRASLAVLPGEPGLARAPRAEDEVVFDIAVADAEYAPLTRGRDGVRRLWEICALPDFRKVAPHAHAELVGQIFAFMIEKGRIPDEWFRTQVNLCDRIDGDIDTLSARIAQIRTWTFCANRDWLSEPLHWQGETRAIEDKLSDALHERLTARFVDRRTSVLMRRLRENAVMDAVVSDAGEVTVEGHVVGQLDGFRFTPDAGAAGQEAKALAAAAQKALAAEIEARGVRLAAAVDEAFALSLDGVIRWLGQPVARLQAGDRILEPRFLILADEQLTGAARDGVDQRLTLWLAAHIKKLLGPLLGLETGEGIDGIGRGIAYQIAENLGVLERASVLNDVKSLDQNARAALRKLGVRFGAYHLTTPALLKPAPRALAAQLWQLKSGGPDVSGLDDIVHLASSGRTSIPVDESIAKGLYRAAGYRVCGARAVRVDILERLADIIRPASMFRPGTTPGDIPAGAYFGDGFTVTNQMTSLVGCAGEDFANILKALGYRMEKKAPLKDVPVIPLTIAAVAPVKAEGEAPAEAIEAAPEQEPSTEEPVAEVSVPETAVETEQAAVADPAIEVSESEPTMVPVTEGEAAPADPAVSIDAAAATPAEPELVDVWRLARFERPEGARLRGNRPPFKGKPGEGQDAKPRWNRDRKPGGENGQSGGDGKQGGKPWHRNKDRDGERGANPNSGKPRFDKRRDDRKPFLPHQGQQPRPEKLPDPNSPFAALLALKEQLGSKK